MNRFPVRAAIPAAILAAVGGLAASPLSAAMPAPDLAPTGRVIAATDLYRGTQAQARAEARRQMGRYGWSPTGSQWTCLYQLWRHESDWRWNSNDGDGYGTWGIPQAHPGYKMRTAGPDWKVDVTTQIRWGLRYIRSAYGSPCRAWSRWQDRAASGPYGWY